MPKRHIRYQHTPPKSTILPSLMSLGPIASETQANVGPSVDIRGESAAVEMLRKPGPYVPSAFGEQQWMLNKLQSAVAGRENIVVSDGLLPLEVGGMGMGIGALLVLCWGRGRYTLWMCLR